MKKRNHPSQKQFMDRTWERAKKVIAGLLKLGSNPAVVQAGDKYEAGLVERVAFLDREKITAKESASLEALYGWGVVNATLTRYNGTPVKGVLIPGYQGNDCYMWLELRHAVTVESFDSYVRVDTTVRAEQRVDVTDSLVKSKMKAAYPYTSEQVLRTAGQRVREEAHEREYRLAQQKMEEEMRLAAEAEAKAHLEEEAAREREQQRVELEGAQDQIYNVEYDEEQDVWISDVKTSLTKKASTKTQTRRKSGGVKAETVKLEIGAAGSQSARGSGDLDRAPMAYLQALKAEMPEEEDENMCEDEEEEDAGDDEEEEEEGEEGEDGGEEEEESPETGDGNDDGVDGEKKDDDDDQNGQKKPDHIFFGCPPGLKGWQLRQWRAEAILKRMTAQNMILGEAQSINRRKAERLMIQCKSKKEGDDLKTAKKLKDGIWVVDLVQTMKISKLKKEM